MFRPTRPTLPLPQHLPLPSHDGNDQRATSNPGERITPKAPPVRAARKRLPFAYPGAVARLAWRLPVCSSLAALCPHFAGFPTVGSCRVLAVSQPRH
jgi:hypothetical protein